MLSSNTSAVSGDANYIEDVFSTYLYTGTGASLTINNNIDLSTKGGLVWCKSRASAYDNTWYDTVRGINKELYSNTTGAQYPGTGTLTSFNTDGFTLGSNSSANSGTSVSWTFRKQPKFFDVVTYTGNGTATNNISHNLGSVPGFIVVKCTSAAGYRWVCAASDNSGNYLYLTLNTTFASDASTVKSNIANSTTFNPGYMGVYFDGGANVSGETYVAYLFASNAGGFGLTGTDNVISCGSYTGNGSTSGPSVTLGYEPQWLLVKATNSGGNTAWDILDNMRGISYSGSNVLFANSSSSEVAVSPSYVVPTATGFTVGSTSTNINESGTNYIYIAIRRGPMKVPTDATTVFKPITHTPNDSGAFFKTSGFPVDLSIQISRQNDATRNWWIDRLRGANGASRQLASSDTSAENTLSTNSSNRLDYMDQVYYGANNNDTIANGGYSSVINWYFRRAPSFFDEVCYTGTGSALTINHNLGVPPEIILTKVRSTTSSWVFMTGFTSTEMSRLYLNTTAAQVGPYSYATFAPGQITAKPTATSYSLGTTNGELNTSGNTYVAYLFATCAGVSKVGSYTGTGTTKQVDCGFAAGARFVLIKRTDSTGDWYVWDTARGIVSGNDPYLLLNSTAAEVTSTDYIDTYSAGFELSSTAPAALNASGGTYIFLAIA